MPSTDKQHKLARRYPCPTCGAESGKKCVFRYKVAGGGSPWGPAPRAKPAYVHQARLDVFNSRSAVDRLGELGETTG
jgi:hypothetical protein